MPTSTRPKISPAPIVPRPAIKNGIDTCNVVFHHSSCLIGWCTTLDGFRSNPFSSNPAALPWSPPFGSSDDAMDVVVIELSEPCDEGGKAENFSFSLSTYNDKNTHYMTRKWIKKCEEFVCVCVCEPILCDEIQQLRVKIWWHTFFSTKHYTTNWSIKCLRRVRNDGLTQMITTHLTYLTILVLVAIISS